MQYTNNYNLKKPDPVTDFYDRQDDNGNMDIIDGALKDHEDRVVTLEGKTDSFYADLEAYYGNVKTIDDFQDANLWTGLSVNDVSNVKIGSQSVRSENGSSMGGLRYIDRNNYPIDLSKLNDGRESGDTDYIYLVFYVSDSSKLNLLNGYYIQINFSSGETFDSNNRRVYGYSQLPVTGWNFLKIKKSQFSINGGATWGNIKSLRLSYNIASDSVSEYVSFQLLQLVKKDPLEDKPNPFQRNGVRDFIINSGEWFVGKEFGGIVIKDLASVVADDGLINDKKFNDFILYAKKIIGFPNQDAYVSWVKDVNNLLIAMTISDNLCLRRITNGVTDDTAITPMNVNVGDTVEYKMEKNGSELILTAYLNGDYSAPYQVRTTTTIEGSGSLALGQVTSYQTRVLAASITEISHAHHADIAEVAKGLTEQLNDTLIGGTQSIPNSVDTKVIWLSSANGNKYGTFDSDNPTKVFLREKGRYLLVFKVAFVANATGSRYCQFKKNDSIIEGIDSKNAVTDTSGITYFTLANTVESDGDDYFEIVVGQKSGVALDITNIPNRSVRLDIQKIG